MLFLVGGQLGGSRRVSLGRGTRGRHQRLLHRLLSLSLAWRRAQNPAPPQLGPRFSRAWPGWPVRSIQRLENQALQGRNGGLSACQGSISRSHLISSGAHLLRYQISAQTCLVLSQSHSLSPGDRAHYSEHKLRACVHACMCLNVSPLLAVFCHGDFLTASFPYAVLSYILHFPSVLSLSSNSLCQSPSPHHPPPCLLPVPKLRLSG